MVESYIQTCAGQNVGLFKKVRQIFGDKESVSADTIADSVPNVICVTFWDRLAHILNIYRVAIDGWGQFGGPFR